MSNSTTARVWVRWQDRTKILLPIYWLPAQLSRDRSPDFVSILCGDIPWWWPGIGASHTAAAELLPAQPASHRTLNTIVRYPAALVSYAHN